jgi:Xaa-Pro aminopeptidase
MQNYILRDENAVYYECGFSCDNEIFLKLGSESFFITDARYTIAAKESAYGVVVVECKDDVISATKELLKNSSIKKLHFDPKDWSVYAFEKLSSDLSFEFVRSEGFSQKKRIIKTQDEIDIIKESVIYGAEAFDLYANYLKDDGLNRSEKYLFFEAQSAFLKHGEFELSFDPIIALNQNSAKPHALPTDMILKDDSFILLDAGLKYKRYCSDRTRCTSYDGSLDFQKEQSFRSSKHQKVYDTVLKAQESAIKAVKAGVKAKDIDKVARDVIEKAGYGKYFIHSTGHGVGLDIHEEPFISKKSDTILKEDMIFTIEPGIYLPDEFGVRIEDMVRVCGDGVEIL